MASSSSSHLQLQPIHPLRSDSQPRTLPELVQFIDQHFPASNANNPDPALSQKVELWLAPATKGVVGYDYKLGNGNNTSADEKRAELELLTGGWADQGLRTKGLAVLLLLCRRLSLTASPEHPVPANQLLPLAQRIFQEGDLLDLSRAGRGLDYLSADIYDLARANNQVPAMLPTLRALAVARAMNSTQTYGWRGVLVPGYKPFLEACLTTRHFVFAKEVLDIPIQDVSMMQEYRDVLSYYYLGGTIYLGLGEWEKARDFFETAVTFPSTSVSAVQIASHKKLVLAQLLINGRTYNYPKYLPSITQRAIKGHTGVYNDLAEAFQALDEKKFLEIRDKHRAEFQHDQNWGFVEAVSNTWYKRKLIKLAKTYKKIELSEAARLINYTDGTEHLQGLVMDLIARKGLHARVIADTYPNSDAARKSLEFIDPEDSYDTSSSISQLAQLKALAAQRTRSLVAENRQLGMNKEWLNSAVKFESESAHGAAATLLAGVPGGGVGGGGGISTGPGRTVRGAGANWADAGF